MSLTKPHRLLHYFLFGDETGNFNIESFFLPFRTDDVFVLLDVRRMKVAEFQ